ncbi:putative reverse transcriptase-rnase h-integrase [Phanerochaete sordida]|uniref:Reverse transcriptase-rnase h-integrase n=1 Tax=Phanerochaete sordida TaxID=48140 RepID=A0A9P3GG80_9APHY|nr:putative reverse transcriptase-rnase h-integrase [Phanerochaete sordida]
MEGCIISVTVHCHQYVYHTCSDKSQRKSNRSQIEYYLVLLRIRGFCRCGYATGGVITQLDPNDKLWHPIASRSQMMSPERLASVPRGSPRALRHLDGSPKPPDFHIVHKPEKTHLIADPLSRPSSLYISDDEDNRSQIVLKPEQFKIAATAVFAKIAPLKKRIRDNSNKKQEVTDALQTLRTKGPHRLQNYTLEWEEHEGLLYYKGKLYLPNSPSLCNDIIQSCHISPTAGHPGKHATLELISRYYWWPRISFDIERYMLGCNQCQCYKPVPHPKATLQPQEVPPGPWEHVEVDLITQLPRNVKTKRDSIAVYVDHHSDQCHLVPVDSTVTAEGMADVHYTDIFRLHGLSRKIFPDRGPQFAARYMRALYKRLGIQTGLTTAYHPEGNGKVERKNQEVEKLLHLFVSQRQDN